MVVEWVQHELLESPITVYNFEVQEHHNYFVGGDAGVLVHNACGSIKGNGKPHGIQQHKDVCKKISNELDSNVYEEVWHNTSLNKVGLRGKQRPDIIAKRRDGTFDIFEVASPSQKKGYYGGNKLKEKVNTILANNTKIQNRDISTIINWLLGGG